MSVVGRGLTGALALALSWVVGAAAAELRPHRALYGIELATMRGSSDINALSGRMVLEWVDACDGWTVNQKVQMQFISREGSELHNEFSFSSFESKNGDNFRFTMRSLANGNPLEEFVGVATRGRAGAVARFTEPPDEKLVLPRDTLFPTEHLFVLVEGALTGETWVGKTVFSGTGLDSLHEVTAFIGKEIPAGSKPVPMAGEGDEEIVALADLRSWPVSMAYFPYDQQDAKPGFEMAYRLMENGVAGVLTLDYGDFAMRATLARLEILPVPDC